MKQRSAHYDSVAKTLHWVIALAIIAMLTIGWVMTDLPKGDPLKFPLFQWHKSIGITILLLSVARLIWRLMNPPPSLPKTMPRWEALAAKATHYLFYALIIGIPLTGWFMVSASPLNVPTMLYGVIPWPHVPVLPTLENKKEIEEALGEVHEFLAFLIAGLLVLHIAAAWKHHLIDRDDVLTRMAPGFMLGLLNRIRGRS